MCLILIYIQQDLERYISSLDINTSKSGSMIFGTIPFLPIYYNPRILPTDIFWFPVHFLFTAQFEILKLNYVL